LGDIDSLTAADLDTITDRVIQENAHRKTRGLGRSPREDTDDIIRSAIEGVRIERIAELYGPSVSAIQQILGGISARIIKRRGGKLTVEDLINPESFKSLVESVPDAEVPIPPSPLGVTPDNWFDTPVRTASAIGALSLGQVYIDEDRPLAWQNDALCAQTDPEAFFPEKGGSTREAKKVCATCEVKEECLEYALANDERFGIWGGLSERERRKLRKSRTGGQNAAPAQLASVVNETLAEYRKILLESKGPYVHGSKRIDQFVELVQADSDLQGLYHKFPEVLAQTVEPLLGEIYPPALGDPSIDKRHQRLLDYFLSKSWDEASRDKLKEDLVDLCEALVELQEEHALHNPGVSFAQSYLDKYEEPEFAESARATA